MPGIIAMSGITFPQASYPQRNARGVTFGHAWNGIAVGYQHDSEKGFLSVQNRLNGEALEAYIKPAGGRCFFVLPGASDNKYYPGQA